MKSKKKKPLKEKHLKDKPCRVCTFRFIPRVSTQVVCCPTCAIALNKIKQSKAYDKKTKELKEGIKSRADHTSEAQVSFNKFIRLRDAANRCISCNRDHSGQYHAGHYISVGSHPELRFNTYNCHKQCAPCNNHLSGNQVRYRRYLVKKIGIGKVESLEGNHDAKHYSISDLKRIKAIFHKKYRLLKAKLDY